MSMIRELDAVALRRPHARWLAGTTGAVVETCDEQDALVELVGPDGRTIDMLTVPVYELVLARPGPGHGPDPDRLAG